VVFGSVKGVPAGCVTVLGGEEEVRQACMSIALHLHRSWFRFNGKSRMSVDVYSIDNYNTITTSKHRFSLGIKILTFPPAYGLPIWGWI